MPAPSLFIISNRYMWSHRITDQKEESMDMVTQAAIMAQMSAAIGWMFTVYQATKDIGYQMQPRGMYVWENLPAPEP